MRVISYIPIEYDLLKIKPDSRLTGTFYDNIIKAIYSTHKNIKGMITQEKTSKYNADVTVEVNQPITYEVMFDADRPKITPTFCFGVPKTKSDYMKQRIQAILPNSTITFEDDYSEMFQDAYVVQYKYSKDSMLSLKIKENNFLQSILNIKNELRKGEKILFQVEMTPIPDTWKSFQDEKWDKIRDGKDVTGKSNIFDKALEAVNATTESLTSIMDEIIEYKDPKRGKSLDKKERAINISQYSTASRNKKNDDGFLVNIRAYIVADEYMAKTYAVTLETAMRELEEDNRLVKSSLKRGRLARGNVVNPFKRFFGNIMSGKELSSIVNIPNQKLQREFKIDSVNIKQVSAPKECLDSSSGIRNGVLQIFGEDKYTYFPKGKDVLAMPKVYMAGMGSGKSTALLNYANDVVTSGQSLIDINFVSKCELAYAIKDMHSDHIIIDFSDENNLPALMLPELNILDTDTPFVRKRKACDCAVEVEYFINSITSKGTEDISTLMGQYLYCAANIVCIYNGINIRTVFDILEDKKVRDKWIDKAIESGVYVEDDYEIRKLRDLDDDKKGSKVAGVLGRYSILMRNPIFRTMLDSNDPKFDFIDIMDNNKSISICMPEDEFRNKATKDVIITYLMCRIRLAMLARKDRDKVCHVLIDEAHHLKSSLDVISHSIAEPRKYGIAFCFCTHYFNQLGDALKEAMLNVGGHYLLLKGVGESAFNELKGKIGEDWCYEDIKEMEDYSSFNMIWIRSQHYMFVTKMLPPLKNKNGKKYIE